MRLHTRTHTHSTMTFERARETDRERELHLRMKLKIYFFLTATSCWLRCFLCDRKLPEPRLFLLTSCRAETKGLQQSGGSSYWSVLIFFGPAGLLRPGKGWKQQRRVKVVRNNEINSYGDGRESISWWWRWNLILWKKKTFSDSKQHTGCLILKGRSLYCPRQRMNTAASFPTSGTFLISYYRAGDICAGIPSSVCQQSKSKLRADRDEIFRRGRMCTEAREATKKRSDFPEPSQTDDARQDQVTDHLLIILVWYKTLRKSFD